MTMTASVEQLIRLSSTEDTWIIACGNRDCQNQTYRFQAVRGEGVLYCDVCGRVSVQFTPTDDEARRSGWPGQDDNR
jgi:hypothetical protein